MLFSLIVILISSVFCKNQTYEIYWYSKIKLDNFTTEDNYYFTLDSNYYTKLQIFIYVNKTDYSSNPDCFKIEYFTNDYDYKSIYINYDDHGSLKTKKESYKDHHLVYTEYSPKNESAKEKEYVCFKILSSKDIINPVIRIENFTGGETPLIANIVFFVIISICLVFCIITLIKTKACGNSDDKYVIPANYAPLQAEIQVAPNQNNPQ